MDRAKLKGYGALLLVFALGVLGGGAGSRAMVQRRYAHLFRDRPALFDNRRLAALSRSLNLDDAQSDEVRAVMNKYGKQRHQLTREIMERCGAPLRAKKSQMDGEIRALLRPDQQALYDELSRDSDKRPPPGPLEPLP